MNVPLFDIRDLAMIYEGRSVLDLKRLSLERGEIVTLLGPNGAGKTTLLEILAFLLQPTEGRIRFDGVEVDYAAAGLLSLRRRVALVPQHPILFTTTVFKNVAFPLKVRRRSKRERKRTVEGLLDLVGMLDFAQYKAHRLSGGESQRVAIARALACSPEVILLDEPTSSVDVENQITIERVIKEIRRDQGMSVIFTTHDLIQASRLADETVVLFEGKRSETTHENLFSGRIEVDSFGNAYCRVNDTIRLPVWTEKRGRVKIAVRPGAVVLRAQREERDAFAGRVIQLTDHQGGVRALVDVGFPVSVILSPASFRSSSLLIGQSVWLTFPKDSVQVLS